MRWLSLQSDDAVKTICYKSEIKIFFCIKHLFVYIYSKILNKSIFYKSNIKFIHIILMIIMILFLIFRIPYTQYYLFRQYYYFFKCIGKSKKISPKDKFCILIILDLFNFFNILLLLFFFCLRFFQLLPIGTNSNSYQFFNYLLIFLFFINLFRN